MLTLEGIEEQHTFLAKVDEYLPLTLEFEPRVLSMDETYYWRGTNSNYLLEIKLLATSGAAAEIALVLIPKERVIKAISLREVYRVQEKKSGLPRFRGTPWANRIGPREFGIEPAMRRYDEHCPFNYFVASDGVAILFDNFSPDYAVVNHQIHFLFNRSDELCGIAVEDGGIGNMANKCL